VTKSALYYILLIYRNRYCLGYFSRMPKGCVLNRIQIGLKAQLFGARLKTAQ